MMVLVIVLTVALLILIAVVIVKLNSQKSERDKFSPDNSYHMQYNQGRIS